jgi:hypothetical protein
MAKPAHDIEMIAERLERFQDFGELEAGAFGCRRPLVHRRAMRNINAAKPGLRTGGRFAERRLGRHHRLQEGQRYGHTRSTKKGTAGEMSFTDEH